VPERWSSLGLTVLKDSLVNWTRIRLEQLGDNGLLPAFISVGNEINIEFMSEEGDYKPSRNVFLLNAVLTLIDDINLKYQKEIKKVIHISSVEHIKWYLEENEPRGLENYDVFANSFYYNENVKYGEWKDFSDIISWIKATYNKDWILLETASPFSWESHDESTNIFNGYPKSFGSNPTTVIQREVLIDRTLDVLRGGGLGVIYWGGDWVATQDQTFIYPNEWGPGSSWENKTFWDKDYNLHEGIEWMNYDYRAELE
jgi:arabinogalactan endo-1,4-beta-galactosidase